MHRATASITLYKAEGVGDFSKGDKGNFYRIAKQLATECEAVSDSCRGPQIAPAPTLIDRRDILVKIGSLLIEFIRSSQGQRAAKDLTRSEAPAASRLDMEKAEALYAPRPPHGYQ